MNKNKLPHDTSYERLIRFPELKQLCGLSRSSVWRLQKNGVFPQSRKISQRACGWLLSEVLEWMGNRKTRCGESKNVTTIG